VGPGGLIVAAAVLVAATVLGLVWKARQGRLRSVGVPTPGLDCVTLLQFSAPACGPCRQLHAMCADIAAANPLVRHTEIDVATDLLAARAHHIRRTPTLLVLDASGAPVWRAVGVPRRPDLDAAVTQILDRQVA
jgi:thiol-disulfide isomerase/thioredoxin